MNIAQYAGMCPALRDVLDRIKPQHGSGYHRCPATIQTHRIRLPPASETLIFSQGLDPLPQVVRHLLGLMKQLVAGAGIAPETLASRQAAQHAVDRRLVDNPFVSGLKRQHRHQLFRRIQPVSSVVSAQLA